MTKYVILMEMYLHLNCFSEGTCNEGTLKILGEQEGLYFDYKLIGNDLIMAGYKFHEWGRYKLFWERRW